MLLTIYSANTFEEFRLPPVVDANYSIILVGTRFALSADVRILLENIGGEWRILSGGGYSVEDGGKKNLAPGDMLSLGVGSLMLSLVVSEGASALSAYAKYDISGIAAVTIGKSPENHIRYDYRSLVSHRHARIVKRGSAFILEDTSANGTYVNNKRMSGSHELRFGDFVSIPGLNMVYLGSLLAVDVQRPIESISLPLLKMEKIAQRAAPPPAGVKGKNLFRRAPRTLKHLYDEPVEIEGPPNLNQPKKQPLLFTIGPAFTMMIPMLLGSGLALFSARAMGGTTGPYMYTGLVTAGASGLIGIIWALMNIRYSRKSFKEEENTRFSLYRDYLIKMADLLTDQYRHNTAALLERYPSAEACAALESDSPQLWNRNTTHSDYLFVRLGLGDIPFQVEINVPKARFTLINDSLAEKPALIKESHRTLHNVPVGVNLLESRLIGIHGGAQVDIASAMIAQLASANAYTDVKIILLLKPETFDHWKSVQWLPHVWSEDKRIRYMACEASDVSEVLYAFSEQMRKREEQEKPSSASVIQKPHYVVFVCDPDIIQGEPAAKYLLQPREELGISTVILSDRFERLPNECQCLIEAANGDARILDMSTMDARDTLIRYDSVSARALDAFAHRVATLEINSLDSGTDIVNSLTFFEMMGVTRMEDLNVIDRWRKNRTYESMRTLIGSKAGGSDIYLDIHEKHHGPHGLVAGTTGSGKSETVQTYILSLAVNFSPHDVGFFIIDFKGGGMANLFSNLPHMLGTISNLSGNQVRRAMVSINSEIRRRQSLFAEYDVNHLDMYTRLFKNGEASVPLPHLLIIIDEFAELKKEEPEFMQRLISVAQVGRSLGVHLILATQKPSGTVDDNIWSNSRFRLCLRVQDRQDSMDMLKKPDAAYILQAGRGFMQVGNDEIYEAFQSGWSGAVYDEDAMSLRTDIATMITLTGQPSLVGNRVKMRYMEYKREQWLLCLGDAVRDILKREGVPLGMCLRDKEEASAFARMVIAELGSRGIDYQDSVYNRARMEEFLTLLESCPPEDDDDARSKWAAAVYTRKSESTQLPKQREKTQLTALVEYIHDIAEKNGALAGLSLWLPVLPEKIFLKDMTEDSGFDGKRWPEIFGQWSLKAPIGLYDDPNNQTQQPVLADFARDGHTAVLGSVVSGKSTLLQTILYALASRYTPDMVQFYALDFGNRMLSPFEELIHCGGVVYEDDLDRVGKFFVMIEKELQRRKILFQGGNYAQYVRANGLKESAVIVAVDGYASFREKTDNAYEREMMLLSAEGANHGIFLLISAAGFGSAEIQNRLGDNIKSIFCLEMGDRFKYMDALRTMRIDVLPEPVKGRGLSVIHGDVLEFQAALCLDAEDDYARAEGMRAQFAQMRAAWNGSSARPIPYIPQEPNWSHISSLHTYQTAGSDVLPFAYRAVDADLFTLPLRETFCYIITGRRRSGKTNALMCIGNAALDKGGRLVIIDSQSGQLQGYAAQCGARYISMDEELIEYGKELFAEMLARNKTKKAMRQESRSDAEIYEAMRQFEPLYILVDDFAEMTLKIDVGGTLADSIGGFMLNFFEKGDLHNIYLIAGMNTDDYSQVVGKKTFEAAHARKVGLTLGGAAVNQRLFDATALPFSEQNRPLKQGEAWAFTEQGEPTALVVPSAKKA